MRKSLIALAALLAVPVLSHAETAHADGVRIRAGGSVRIGGSARVRVGRDRPRPSRRVRVAPRPRHHHLHVGGQLRFGGGLFFGVRFAEPPPPPPPPPCEFECGGVPAYYTGGYTGTYAPSAPAAAVYQPAPEPLPRWGLGVFAGSVAVEGQDAGSDLGLVGRFRLSEHLELEAELAKSELEAGGRVDRRVGGALLYDFRPRSTWSIFVLGGAGYGHTEMGAGSLEADQGYAELGAGLTWRVSDRLHLIGDLRGGRRHTDGDSVALKSTAPVGLADREDYNRARLGALLYF